MSIVNDNNYYMIIVGLKNLSESNPPKLLGDHNITYITPHTTTLAVCGAVYLYTILAELRTIHRRVDPRVLKDTSLLIS